jgi:hypothetical protein
LANSNIVYTTNENHRLFLFANPWPDLNGQGIMNSARVTIGQALYTGNFTPPTQQLSTNSVGTTGANVAASLTGTVTFLGGTTSNFIDASASNNTLAASPPSFMDGPSATLFYNSTISFGGGPHNIVGTLNITGKLGINCNAPNNNFTVNGTSYFTSNATFDTQIVGLGAANQFGQGGGNYSLVGNTGYASGNALYAAGTIYAAGAITGNSDERVKQNIEPANLSMCYSTFQQLNLRRFQWDSNYFPSTIKQDMNVLGFIAQEVQTVLPKAVYVNDDRQTGLSSFQSLNAEQIQYTHFGATQYLTHVIEQQQSTMESLVVQNSTLTQLSFVIPPLVESTSSYTQVTDQQQSTITFLTQLIDPQQSTTTSLTQLIDQQQSTIVSLTELCSIIPQLVATVSTLSG